MTTPSDHHKPLVLVTGASGAVGRPVVRALLADGLQVRGLDRTPHGELDDEVLGDIADAAVWDQALRGVDTLVHLAATPDQADFMDKLLGPNVAGVYRAFEGAVKHGLRRVVFASTIQTVSGQRIWRDDFDLTRPVGPDEVCPKNHYGLTKCWAEELGRMYARNHGLSVVNARIGWLLRDAEGVEHMRQHPGGQGIYVSHDDAGRFFVAAVRADHAGYGSYWCMGPGAADEHGKVTTRFDLEPGRARLGYEPQDVFPAGSVFEKDVPARTAEG